MIGVFGGTFDPVHYGHLRAAREALQQLDLAELRLLPAAVPPHRPPPQASRDQRRRMIELAIQGSPGLCLDDRELNRDGMSYTLLTLQSLRIELGDTPLCLLIGNDQLRSFESWYHWQDIPDLAHLVVLSRPNSGAARLPDWAAPRLCTDFLELSQQPAGRLAFLPVSPQDISATQIRSALARGDSVQGLMPEAVIDYIRANRIYGQ